VNCYLPKLMGGICGMLILIVLLNNSLLAQNSDSMKARVDALAQPYIDSDTVVGMTIGIIKDGQSEIFGYGVVDSGADNEFQVKPDGNQSVAGRCHCAWRR